ncbi:cell division protein DedD [Serratia sp. MYb239]|uniref:cell division protein DedD n=1 Tax=Serratia sp. MYb239 TaxID=2033438 RepID=UPI000CF6DEEA|nr:cell division protein DedD [Serratia sp. MYb239]AVJ18618.1 cell division protein DedD [Serratia sp. MYb239]
MASKFQNRLVGTVVLVALGVIILPGLLDGKKKHYEDEFAAIPLVPKPGDARENDAIPPVSQPLPSQPPAGTGALMEQQAANEAATQQAVTQPQQNTAPPPAVTTPSPAPQPKPAEKAPSGQAYVVQLGALKNAAKVNEIVASLRLSGYRAFTVPSTPVQGQITRIYVGPDASKQKLQSSLSALNSLSGLNGQVKPYSAR